MLRLLLIHQQINLLCIPALCIQLLMVANPSGNLPHLFCLLLEVIYTIVATNLLVSDMAVALGRYKLEMLEYSSALQSFDLFRLFYLWEDNMTAYIEERSFFNYLKWLHPALSGIFTSMLLGEHFLYYNESQTLLLWQSSCYKIPMLWEESLQSIHYNVISLLTYSITLITLCTQIALFIRQRQLERQRAEGVMVIYYNSDGVTMSRRTPDQPSCQQLWRHKRTVVSPEASFLTFLLRILLVIPQACHYFIGIHGSSGPTILVQFVIFYVFCKYFFLKSLIETLFSPTLRNSLTDLFPCLSRGFHAVVV